MITAEDLPSGWALARVGDLLVGIEAGASFACEERPPNADEIGVIKISAVTWGEYDEQESKTCLDSSRYDERLIVHPGDFLLSRANTIELVGACVIVSQTTKRIMLSDKILRLKWSGVDPRWALHCLRSREGRQQIESASSGNQQSMRNISQTALREILIPLPPLREQQAIVQRLDELRSRTQRTKKTLDTVPAQLDQLRQSILTAAFRGDLTADWRTKHPRVESADRLVARIRAERRREWEVAEFARLVARGKRPPNDQWKARYEEPDAISDIQPGALPDTWQWARLEFIRSGDAPMVYGIILPGEHVPNGIPYVRPVDIAADGSVDVSALKRTTPEIAGQYERASLKAGDIILSIVGTIGKVAVASAELEGANITQSSIRIRPGGATSTEFLKWVLQAPCLVQQYNEFRFGNAVQRLNVDHVRQLIVPLPPQEEQAELCARIRDAMLRMANIDINAERGRLAQLDAAILAKAFRGELVPQDPNDEPASVLLERIRAARTAADSASRAPRGRHAARGPAPAADPDEDVTPAAPPSPARVASAPREAAPPPPPAPPVAASRATAAPSQLSLGFSATVTRAAPKPEPAPRRAARAPASSEPPAPTALDELDAAALQAEVLAALWPHGPLEKDEAVRRVAEHLRASGRVSFQRLRSDGPLYAQLLGAIEAAVKTGALDRPRRGSVRACKADAAAYTMEDWRHALLASLGEEPTDRDEALRAAAEWAREHLGLAFERLREDGHILQGLRSALNSAIRRGEVQRHGAQQISLARGTS